MRYNTASRGVIPLAPSVSSLGVGLENTTRAKFHELFTASWGTWRSMCEALRSNGRRVARPGLKPFSPEALAVSWKKYKII